MRYALALALALVLNASANLMMKVGSRRFGDSGITLERGVGPLIASVLSNGVLLLGLCCFATNVIFYAYALSGPKMQISVAYPVMVGGGFAIIAIVAWKYLGETLSVMQWAGVGLILAGLILVAREMGASPDACPPVEP